MPSVKSVTYHAVNQFMARSGVNKEERAANKLFRLADSAIPMGDDRYYSQGWVVVIKHGVVRTVFRPKGKRQLNAVYEACQSVKT